MPVEAADLVVLTQPWEASDGRRELLLVSPRGLARYWPDLLSPRRFTDVNARSVTAGQSVRVFFLLLFCFVFLVSCYLLLRSITFDISSTLERSPIPGHRLL